MDKAKMTYKGGYMSKNKRMVAIQVGNAGSEVQAVIDRLVYHTPIANDHILHELQARYGEIIAWHVAGQMPKASRPPVKTGGK